MVSDEGPWGGPIRYPDMPRPGAPKATDWLGEFAITWHVEPDPDWRGLHRQGLRCRYGVGADRCPNPAIAALMRPVGWWGGQETRRPWAYCQDHLYGRWIERGYVVAWRWKRVER